MRVSGLVITHQLTEQASAWLAKVNDVVDELVAVVAQERAQPDVIARLQALGARIVRPTWSGFYPSNEESRAMIAACTGDWILKVDHDEELSREWHDPVWREILREDEFTHFWVPRRWMVAKDEFLEREPWWPDWQLRLLKNCPGKMTFATQLHDFMGIAGPAAYLRTLSLHHHDLWLCSRAEREAKARAYEALRPGHGLGYFYLYEEAQIRPSRLKNASQFSLETEVLRMQTLSPEAINAISLEADPPPRFLRPRETFWLNVTVKNGSNETLRFGAPHPLNLAYHWLRAPSREFAVFDGLRTALLPELAPGQEKSWKVFVIAPPQSGEYVLQLSMVQERVRWLEDQNPGLVREFEITVQGQIQPRSFREPETAI